MWCWTESTITGIKKKGNKMKLCVSETHFGSRKKEKF